MRIGRFLSVTEVRNYITEYHAPALFLFCSGQIIPNANFTMVEFTAAIYDELGMWTIGDPTKIHTPNDAIWTVGMVATWIPHATGQRWLQLEGTHSPYGHDEFPVASRQIDRHNITSMIHIDASDPTQLEVWQNSGGNLELDNAYVIMVKHVDIAYPV